MEFNKELFFKAGFVLLCFGVLLTVILLFVYPTLMGGLQDVAKQRMAERFSDACHRFCGYDTLNSTLLMVYGDLSMNLYSCRCSRDMADGRLHRYFVFTDLGLVKDNLKSVSIFLNHSNCTSNGWQCAEANGMGTGFVTLNSTGGGFSSGGEIFD
jgi:hypothetical protein